MIKTFQIVVCMLVVALITAFWHCQESPDKNSVNCMDMEMASSMIADKDMAQLIKSEGNSYSKNGITQVFVNTNGEYIIFISIKNTSCLVDFGYDSRQGT